MLGTSCSMFHDDLDPCKQKVNFNIVFDKNMQGLDQFDSKVHCAKVLLYDNEGNFYGEYDYDKTDKLSLMLPPGDYHAIAYGGVSCTESDVVFNIPTSDNHHFTTLETSIKGTRSTEVSKDLHDYFHALGDLLVKSLDYGEVNHTFHLTKNTNRFRLELMYTDGRKINANNFKVYLTADNAVTDHANNVIKQGSDVVYRNYQSGNEQTDVVIDGNKAWHSWFEIATGRLTEDTNVRLHIDRAAWPDVFVDMPLLEYLKEVKKKELSDASLQEYLDRQDEWTLTFTIEPDIDQFTVVSLKINNWNMVINGFDF